MGLKSNKIATKDKIGISELFKLKRMKPYIKPTKPHRHQGYHEIILITKGEGFHTIEFNSHEVIPPVIFFLQPGQIHNWEFTEKPDGFVLMFKPEFLQNLKFDFFDNLRVNEKIQLNDSNRHEIEMLFDAIEEELSSKRENYKSAIASYLRIMLIKLGRISDKSQSINESSNSKYTMFNNLVRLKFRTEKKVSRYADLLHVSRKHLNELCKKESGKTASSIINSVVSTEAKRLLIHTDNNISEVAFNLGFDDASHFTKFFKGQTGVTPTQFREERFQ